MAVLLRLVQRFQHARKSEFMELEKQFAELEHRGILPRESGLLLYPDGNPGTPLYGSAGSKTLQLWMPQ